jgi:hypothetical protein
MRKILLATTAAIALAGATAPAHAVLQLAFQANAGPITVCTDGGACDNGGQTNQIIQFNQNVGQFNISGIATESQKSAGGPNSLQLQSLIITNNGGFGTLSILAGDNGFFGPVTSISNSGSGTFFNNIGATETLSFFANPNNTQPALGNLGTNLFNVSKTITTNPDSESGTAVSAFFNGGQFSMAERAVLQFEAGGSVTGFAQSMVASAVPELGTWGMMVLGFAGVGLLGISKRRNGRGFRLA